MYDYIYRKRGDRILPAYRLSIAALGLILIMTIAPLSLLPDCTKGYSNEYLFDEAKDIYFDTNIHSDHLDNVDSRRVYRIVGLVGDERNNSANAHRLVVSLIKKEGANIRGAFYEPNGRPLATFYSEGERSEVEFYVPYDGNYFLEVMADPFGSFAAFDYQLGGQQNSNNNLFDGNNKPGMTGFSGTREIGGNLHPTHDVVDYHQFNLDPLRAFEAVLISTSPFRMDILDDNQDLVAELESGQSYEGRNDNDTEMFFIFRIYYLLDGNSVYSPIASSYSLNVFVWSHTTIPMVNVSDPWPSVISIDEDTPLDPPINLSSHFIEPGGDPLTFAVTSNNTNIDVRLVNTTVGTGHRKWTYAEVFIQPHPNWHGQEVVSFMASDRDGSVTDSFTLEVREVNDHPFVTRIGNVDYTGGVFNLYATEGETRVYKMEYGDVDDPMENLFFTTNASSFIELFFELYQNGTLVFSPLQEHVGNYFFNVTLNDGRGGYFILDMRLEVIPVNDPPHVPEIMIVKGNMTLMPGEEITVMAVSLFDPDGDALSVVWHWGDGRTSTGIQASHIYPLPILAIPRSHWRSVMGSSL